MWLVFWFFLVVLSMCDLLLWIYKCLFIIVIDVFICWLVVVMFWIYYGSEIFVFYCVFLFYNIKYICLVGDIYGVVLCGVVGKYRDGIYWYVRRIFYWIRIMVE